ncbi:MAG: enoyl-[acyl-carrier-protein] reductase FabI [Planctomycetota bacterium]|nr:MAG: enoyl-[acyl-carrier-protein] reductase FabI [Planctomycetota bacterium]
MLLKGKKGLIFGVANEHSLAWHIAKQVHAQGAEVILSVASERFLRKVGPLAERLGAPTPIICDVADDDAIAKAFAEIGQTMPKVDFLVHAIATAKREDLQGRFVDTSRDGFALAHDVSTYSFLALCRAAEPLLQKGASLLTLTYLGAIRAVPSYNVMGVAKASLESSVRYLANDFGPLGIRVNAISAGPVKTLSASVVKGFKDKVDIQQVAAPLRRNVTGEDVGKSGLFLLSDMASGVTGEILYVDCGYNIMADFITREV